MTPGRRSDHALRRGRLYYGVLYSTTTRCSLRYSSSSLAGVCAGRLTLSGWTA